MWEVFFLASLYYPVEAAATKSGNDGQRTLDGLAYVSRSSPGEYAAIQWLRENASEGDGIVEAVGDSWSTYGRVSIQHGAAGRPGLALARAPVARFTDALRGQGGGRARHLHRAGRP